MVTLCNLSSKILFIFHKSNCFRDSYTFWKSFNFSTPDKDALMLHTVGKVIYTDNNISLRAIDDDSTIELNFPFDSVPKNEMFIHLYGILRSFLPKECYTKRERRSKIDVHFWNDLECHHRANVLKNVLDEINCNI